MIHGYCSYLKQPAICLLCGHTRWFIPRLNPFRDDINAIMLRIPSRRSEQSRHRVSWFLLSKSSGCCSKGRCTRESSFPTALRV